MSTSNLVVGLVVLGLIVGTSVGDGFKPEKKHLRDAEIFKDSSGQMPEAILICNDHECQGPSP